MMTTQRPYRDTLTLDQQEVIAQVEYEVAERLFERQDASDIVNAALFMFVSWATPMTDAIAYAPWKDVAAFTSELNGYLYDKLRPYGIPGNKQPYRGLEPTVRVRLTEDLTHKIIQRFCPDWLRL